MSHDPLDLGPTRRHFTPGSEVFGRYELIERIGAGKLGEVWKARDKRLDLTVAIKLLENFAQFSAVAGTVGKAFGLTHPNIVRTYGFEGDADLCGFIMEYVKGQTLADVLRSKEPPFFEVGEVRPWALQLFTALKFASEQGKLIHGDVRPANLFITSGGTLKIAEFGLAASRQGEPIREDSYATSTFSLPCLSPQRVEGEVPHHLDDVYAAGACLYEALTGKSVFPGGNVIAQIQRKVPPTIAERRKELERKGEPLPKAWESLIAKCSEKERADRPASAAEVLAALDTIADAATRATSTKKQPRNADSGEGSASLIKNPLVIGLGALAACAVLMFMLFVKPRNEALESMRAAMKQLDLADAADQAVPADQVTDWESFITRYTLEPVAFTDEDDTMITRAGERAQHWSSEMRRLAAEAEDRQRKITEATSRLRAALVQQQQADTIKTFTITDRIQAWGSVLKQFTASDQPDTKDYKDLLAQVSAAQKVWSDKEAAVKKDLADKAAKLLEETRIAEQKAGRWREDRESAWASITAINSDPNVSALVKVEKLAAFIPTLADAPFGAEKRAGELLALANDASKKALELANVETPKEPLKLPELLAESPIKDQPDAVKKAFVFLMQQKLKEKGLYKDTPDGDHGRGSHTALVTFQKDTKRLIANAKLDAATIKELGLDQLDLVALAEQGRKMLATEKPSGSSSRTSGRRKPAEPVEEPSFFNKVGKGFATFGKGVGKAVKDAVK